MLPRSGLKKIFFVFSTTVAAVGYVLLSKESKLFISSPGDSRETERLALFDKNPSFIQNSTCYHKNQSIFYIKIQKTGSTTVKSMLLNYAAKHGMRICLDNTDIHHMNFPYRLDESKLIRFPDEPCEIIADELVFKKSQGTFAFSLIFFLDGSFLYLLKVTTPYSKKFPQKKT